MKLWGSLFIIINRSAKVQGREVRPPNRAKRSSWISLSNAAFFINLSWFRHHVNSRYSMHFINIATFGFKQSSFIVFLNHRGTDNITNLSYNHTTNSIFIPFLEYFLPLFFSVIWNIFYWFFTWIFSQNSLGMYLKNTRMFSFEYMW